MASLVQFQDASAGLRIRIEGPFDVTSREALLDSAMGPSRRLRTSERLREGQIPAISLVAEVNGNLVGSIRLWQVKASGLVSAMLLGPLAVDRTMQGLGIGAALMRTALEQANRDGTSAVLLVGDPAYYERFGFSARSARRLSMPGPFERHRMLGLELQPGALCRAHGVLKPASHMTVPTGLAA